MKSNSITKRKRILAESKVGSGRGRACSLRHACGLKRGRGTWFGLILGVFEQDFDETDTLPLARGREYGHVHRGRDTGL